MVKRTITYTDYDGNERTEDFYFHLTKAELVELNFSLDGGLEKIVEEMTQKQDIKRIIELIKSVLLMSYGEKSLDGKRFQKSQELRDAFTQTEAYSQLFMELAQNAEGAADFINGIMPKA